MALTAKAKGVDYDPVPEGLHYAICIGVFDIGTHFKEAGAFAGRDVREVIFMWELPDERIDIEKDGVTRNLPKAISATYTLSIHKKSRLRPILESWRGKKFTEAEAEGFDVMKVLGAPCTVQVLHTKKDDKVYANVSNVIPLMKGMERKTPENPLRSFSFEDQTTIPDGVPQWIQDKITSAQEWGGGKTADKINDEFSQASDDQIPF